jgi:secondary thiamine-phosphate synthase enzyme
MHQEIRVQTQSQIEFVNITRQVQAAVTASGISEGTLYLYCVHTSCGLTIQENTDPGVAHDVMMLLKRISPQSDPGYRHNEDNSASHFQTCFMGTHQIVFIQNGRLVLGRWQALFLTEFDGPRERTVLWKIQPDR